MNRNYSIDMKDFKHGLLALNIFSTKGRKIINDNKPSEDLKSLLIWSFGLAIKSRQSTMVLDFIEYAKSKFIDIFITDNHINNLLVYKQFALMQTLIEKNLQIK